MRICIYGAGAIGGLLAVRLAQAGEDVSVIARGAHLAAIRRHGLRLQAAVFHELGAVPAANPARELQVHVGALTH